MFPEGQEKNSDKILWTLMDIISPNPETRLIEFAIKLFDLFKVRQVGLGFAKAERVQEQL